jgi:hypothetical protein
MASEAVRRLVEEAGSRIVKGRDEVGASWPKIARVIGLSNAAKDTEVDHGHIRMVRAAYKVAKGTAPSTGARQARQADRERRKRGRISGGSSKPIEKMTAEEFAEYELKESKTRRSKAAARREAKASKLDGLTSEEVVAMIAGRRISWRFSVERLGASPMTTVAKVRDVTLGRDEREIVNFWEDFDAKTGEATGGLRSVYIDQIVEVS